MDYDRFNTLCSKILVSGVERLSLAKGAYLAIVSQIENDEYEVVSVHSRANVFTAGESYPLSDTLCNEVYTKGITIAFTGPDKPDRVKYHPLYSKLQIEVYISTPIYKGDQIWGTLNFSDLKTTRSPFTEEDIDFIESSAGELSDVLSSSDLNDKQKRLGFLKDSN